MKRSSLVLLLIPLFKLSCTTAELTSHKDPAFNEKIDDVLIIIRGAKVADLYFEELGSKLDSTFFIHGVESNHYVAEGVRFGDTSLDLNPDGDKEKEVNRKIEKQVLLYGPTYILFIRQAYGKKATNVSTGEEFNRGGTFDLQLFKKHRKGMVWRAKMDLYTEQKAEYTAELSSRKIFEKLVEDGLITPLPSYYSNTYN
jgi:hypothetical protein